ncbi:class I SAM-dependent methyltransferase [Deefgea rivuli]|uniref:class I SAM-dependent methyltransferase n=1 Tax=Deefgea rivuli TaxID=400948 RepID=UPI000481A8D9|nr:hypothetical protein [Deefgea rivuli]
MNRKEIILKHVIKNGRGIEVGSSHNPIAPKKAGYNVQIIDHLDKSSLIDKYKDHGVNIANIEDVDFIWNGESYSDLTGRTNFYDWIIASHVIEHTTDLIGFLNDCSNLLNENGILSLAIPDKRYCFDHFRPVSGLSRIIDNHLNNQKIHSAGAVIEYFLNATSKDGKIAWNSSTTVNPQFSCVHNLDDAKQALNNIINNQQFYDIHEWCFTPTHTLLILQDLLNLELINLHIIEHTPTIGHEFFITLSKIKTTPQVERHNLLKQCKKEAWSF